MPTVGLALLMGAGLPRAGLAADVRIEHIETSRDGDVRSVHVKASAPLSYSIFRLTEPHRILIDVAGAELATPLAPLDVRDGVLRTVRAAPLPSGDLRIEVELSSLRDYRTVEKGRELVLLIDGPPRDPAHIGRLELRQSGDEWWLTAPLEGHMAPDAVHIEALHDPGRLVLDLHHADVAPKYQRLSVGRLGVRQARVANKDGSVRVVLDLQDPRPQPRVRVDSVSGTLRIRLSTLEEAPAAKIAAATTPSAPAAEPETEPPPSTEPPAVAPPPSETLPTVASTPADPPTPTATPAAVEPEFETTASVRDVDDDVSADQIGTRARPEPAARVLIRDIRFEPRDGFIRFTVELSRTDFEVMEAGTKEAPRLVLPGTRLPARLERTLDVTAVSNDSITGLSSYNSPDGAILAAGIYDDTEHRHWRKENRLMWDFRSRSTAVGPESTASYTSGLVKGIGQLATGRKRYTGRRISLDLKDADIQNVLRLLADVSRINIVASDDVQGKVTIKLRNVPWDQALDIILRSKQLDKTRNGNIIRVAPLETLRREEELRLERQKAQIELEPLSVRLIPVSYAVAKEIQPQVTALLSPRGKVNIDQRTNVLIVEDISEILVKVERLVRTLDTQTPQVLIESRIVEASTNFSRELGVQWGGTVNFSNQFGNSTGLGFPDTIRVSGGADDIQNNVVEGVVANPQYAVNLPATVGSGGGGALGLVLGSLDGSALINLRLSAAEAVGKIKLISAPKIVTLDNKEARILSGERVPITVITANGPTTRFINANLELGVTPHVTQDGAILMKIEATKNELSDRVDFLGVPGINTNEARTEMIVQDGDTAVLGGLYRRNKQTNESYVPWIGQVPVIGWLFKTTSASDVRDELLIFISPRIVNRQSALVNPN
jgi:type IV pilus assembly protein PilQ